MSHTLSIHFVEQRLRGTTDFQCFAHVVIDHDLTNDCVFAMGKDWTSALIDCPDARALACMLASSSNLAGLTLGNLGKVSIHGAEGLYSESELKKLSDFLSKPRMENEDSVLCYSSVSHYPWDAA